MTEGRRKSLKKYNCSLKRKLVNKRYRESHKEQCNLWIMKWQKENRERVNSLARLRNKTPDGRLLRIAKEERYNACNREKRLAKNAVNNAVRVGKIIKLSCAVCGNVLVEGHHPDYDNPLEVIWLCKSHHSLLHKELKLLKV